MDYFKAEIFGKSLVIRDMVEDDVETIVRYWHDGNSKFLYSLGADPSKLVSRDATRERLHASLRKSIQPNKAYFVVAAETELLAYTNLSFRSESEACAHFHVLQRTPRVKATMYVLFPNMVKLFFAQFRLERIEMQTLPENRNIDRLLRRFGLKARRAFLDNPDGFGRPGELNIWELRKNGPSLPVVDARHVR